MKVKTADLIDLSLDWAVAIITNPQWTDEDRWYNTIGYVDYGDPDDEPYSPSTDWSQGGPIIEQGEIELLKWSLDGWAARDTNYQFLNTPQERPYFAEGYGPTPLIAACRCLVASQLGEEVDIPEELLK